MLTSLALSDLKDSDFNSVCNSSVIVGEAIIVSMVSLLPSKKSRKLRSYRHQEFLSP